MSDCYHTLSEAVLIMGYDFVTVILKLMLQDSPVPFSMLPHSSHNNSSSTRNRVLVITGVGDLERLLDLLGDKDTSLGGGVGGLGGCAVPLFGPTVPWSTA